MKLKVFLIQMVVWLLKSALFTFTTPEVEEKWRENRTCFAQRGYLGWSARVKYPYLPLRWSTIGKAVGVVITDFVQTVYGDYLGRWSWICYLIWVDAVVAHCASGAVMNLIRCEKTPEAVQYFDRLNLESASCRSRSITATIVNKNFGTSSSRASLRNYTWTQLLSRNRLDNCFAVIHPNTGKGC